MKNAAFAAIVAALLFGCVALGYGVAAVWPAQSEPWPPPAPPPPGYKP